MTWESASGGHPLIAAQTPRYRQVTGTLSNMLTEIFDGPPGRAAYLLNQGDPGLLRRYGSVDPPALPYPGGHPERAPESSSLF